LQPGLEAGQRLEQLVLYGAHRDNRRPGGVVYFFTTRA
jgi:hypothetical protein